MASKGEGAAIEAFVARWQGREGGQERANYAMFLTELCAALELPSPEPASARSETNDYVFERRLDEVNRDGAVSHPRIDLYKRNHFVLEAKQSRRADGAKPAGAADLFGDAPAPKREAGRGWDVLMLNARRQAEDYVRLLPAGHEAPPFVIVCDVGHCFEIYANFRRDGKAYDQFPDRSAFRIRLEDLRTSEARNRLKAIWTDPLSLDPAREAARVTRDIARRLAKVSKVLEGEHPAEQVALFLMRCLFTMFADSVGLLPKTSFRKLLAQWVERPEAFPHELSQLWEAMNKGGYAHALHERVREFNGKFFESSPALPLAREEIGELLAAAEYDWRDVDPSIFGTLLEQALDPRERRKLGAHYTPRAYVERLVAATVIDPLREEWKGVLATAERFKANGRPREALATVRAFHEKLCKVRVFDPACGAGNFLYVALEMLKRLEGEVLETLADLGGQEHLSWLESHNVAPSQFLGLEVNPRAAAIAELVLWIGYLQWHIRTKGGLPPDPVLQAYNNIACADAVLAADKGREYRDPRRPVWPEAEFIVGNPPFIGGKDLRARLGESYAQALWAAHPHMNESADFVMYWWDRAAELLTRKGTALRRFGFVTTNSISQVFQRRVMERHLNGKPPVSLVMAIPDHPWTKATKDAAAVRIAMTVCEAGAREGVLREVVREAGTDTDAPLIELAERAGTINSDLTVGVDVTAAKALLANEGICSPGMKLHGAGFIVTPQEAAYLGLGRRLGLERHIRHYRNGRDLMARSRGRMVIDLFGLEAEKARARFPEVYQHVLAKVKPERDRNNREVYRAQWWTFGEPRRELRPALDGLSRFAATVETAKHRVFQFLDTAILPDNMLVAIASDDAFTLGVLSSRIHVGWTLAQGGTLEDRPRYTKSLCFDPFPFPAANAIQRHCIRRLAEHLDAHRKRVLAEHPHLTLTALYNVLERLRGGARPDALDPAERRIFDDGQVLILKEFHDGLDAAVAEAYGWPASLSDEDILARLVALNRERAREEAQGQVRWLRPEYQEPRFGQPAQRRELDLTGGGAAPAVAGPRPPFPAEALAQTEAVRRALGAAAAPLSVEAIASQFKGRKVAQSVGEILLALARTGEVAAYDGGAAFALRRVA